MIIKFEVNGAWQLFDGVDSLRYQKLGPHSVAEDIVDNAIDYTDSLRAIASDQFGFPGRVLLTFTNAMKLMGVNDEYPVVAFSPIYLMNDSGRTIETI